MYSIKGHIVTPTEIVDGFVSYRKRTNSQTLAKINRQQLKFLIMAKH